MSSPPRPPRFYGLDGEVFSVLLHEPRAGTVPEAFVQDLWLRRCYRPDALRTTRGAPVEGRRPSDRAAT